MNEELSLICDMKEQLECAYALLSTMYGHALGIGNTKTAEQLLVHMKDMVAATCRASRYIRTKLGA